MSAQSPSGPVFVIGAARSGTTLTYSILTSSDEFPVYEAESRLIECGVRYGPLNRETNRMKFVKDYLSSRQYHRTGLEKEYVVNQIIRRSDNYYELLGSLMETIARRQGKRRWAEKSPNNVYYINKLAQFFPTARFIHVIRDGRAVAVSQRRIGWGERYTSDRRRQLMWTSNIWKDMVTAGIQGRRLEERYLEIKYEELVQSLPTVIDRIANFVDCCLEMDDLRDSEIGSLKKANSSYADSSVGVSGRYTNRWKATVSQDEYDLLNWNLHEVLAAFGYKVTGPSGSQLVSFGDRVYSRLSFEMLRAKRWLNHHTYLGRVARKPLEIGLKSIVLTVCSAVV